MSTETDLHAMVVQLQDRALEQERRLAEQQALLSAQQEAIREQDERLQCQESQLSFLRRGGVVADRMPDEATASRRTALRYAGTAAAGAIAATLARAQPIAAADNEAVFIANPNATSTTTPPSTTINYASANASSTRNFVIITDGSTAAPVAGAALLVRADTDKTFNGIVSIVSPPVVRGSYAGYFLVGANGNQNSRALSATNAGAGIGLYSSAVGSGYSAFFGNNGRIGMDSHLLAGPPVSGSYGLGDMVRDSNGNLWHCVTAGVPGVWRKMSGPATAGQLHLLDAPVRVLDTRAGQQPAALNPPKGQLAANSDRVVDLKQGTLGAAPAVVPAVPAGALGALINVVIVNSTGQSYLAVWRNGIPWPGNANVNTFGAGQNLAATTVTALDASGNCQIRASLPCDVVIDVIGYYR